MYVDSFYNKLIRSNDRLIARGFDYGANGIIDKFVSPRMYLVDRIAGFLNMIDPSLIELIDSVKRVQFYYNYTMDKNDRSLNF
jgi:hypothetical protein